MKKILKYLSLFILVIAQFAAATPSQLGSYQAEVPNKLKKWLFTFLVFTALSINLETNF